MIKIKRSGYPLHICACSSVGQSARLRLLRSQVRILSGAPVLARTGQNPLSLCGNGFFVPADKASILQSQHRCATAQDRSYLTQWGTIFQSRLHTAHLFYSRNTTTKVPVLGAFLFLFCRKRIGIHFNFIHKVKLSVCQFNSFKGCREIRHCFFTDFFQRLEPVKRFLAVFMISDICSKLKSSIKLPFNSVYTAYTFATRKQAV